MNRSLDDPSPDLLLGIANGIPGREEDAVTYDGWRNIASETDSAFRGRYAWPGRELDTETGLQYNRARCHDPSTGRWISQDPLAFNASDGDLYPYPASDE